MLNRITKYEEEYVHFVQRWLDEGLMMDRIYTELYRLHRTPYMQLARVVEKHFGDRVPKYIHIERPGSMKNQIKDWVRSQINDPIAPSHPRETEVRERFKCSLQTIRLVKRELGPAWTPGLRVDPPGWEVVQRVSDDVWVHVVPPLQSDGT